ncbi:MAG: D-alanyl-D-alanine carboxypeptidase family protein [Pseudomonadota bacterium]
MPHGPSTGRGPIRLFNRRHRLRGGHRLSLSLSLVIARITAGAVLCLALLGGMAAAQEMSTPARAAFVKDLQSGAVLLAKQPDVPLPPASMSKLMTLFMVFEALENGRLHLEDEFRTSARAAALGGSKMFTREGERVSIANLLRGVAVQSGNDASVALAEALAGTEEAFAELMNRRAGELGLENAHFKNATGWPEEGHEISVRDLATLAEMIITRFPERYTLFSEREFTWDGITQRNRNPLLGNFEGADGMKTGHTEDAGYGLVASAKRGERRVLMVLAGMESQGQRRQEAERLMNWAFRAFETKVLHRAGEAVVEAEVWIGAADSVALAPTRDVILTAPLGTLEKAEVTARFDAPVPAPIAAGDRIGEIEIVVPGLEPVIVPLQATEAVAPGGFVARLEAATSLLIGRALGLAGL